MNEFTETLLDEMEEDGAKIERLELKIKELESENEEMRICLVNDHNETGFECSPSPRFKRINKNAS